MGADRLLPKVLIYFVTFLLLYIYSLSLMEINFMCLASMFFSVYRNREFKHCIKQISTLSPSCYFFRSTQYQPHS